MIDEPSPESRRSDTQIIASSETPCPDSHALTLSSASTGIRSSGYSCERLGHSIIILSWYILTAWACRHHEDSWRFFPMHPITKALRQGPVFYAGVLLVDIMAFILFTVSSDISQNVRLGVRAEPPSRGTPQSWVELYRTEDR